MWPPCVVKPLEVLDPDLGPAAGEHEQEEKSQSHFVVPVALYLQTSPSPHPEPVSPPSLHPSWPQDARLLCRIHSLQHSVLHPCVSLAGEHHAKVKEAAFPGMAQHLDTAFV